MASKIQKAFKDKLGLDISALSPDQWSFDLYLHDQWAEVEIEVTEVKTYSLSWSEIEEFEDD